MKTFILSDIHGLYDEMMRALGHSGFDRRADRLIALGDYTDAFKGSHEGSLMALDFLSVLSQEQRHAFIRGNHERMLLASMNDAAGGYEDQRRLLHAMKPEHVSFIRGRLVNAFEGDGWVAVHDSDEIDKWLPHRKDLWETVIISGHLHLDGPAVRYRQVVMAGDDRIYVMDVDNRIIYDSEGKTYNAEKAWE